MKLIDEEEIVSSVKALKLMTASSVNICIPIVSESDLKLWLSNSMKSRIYQVYPPPEDITTSKEDEGDEGSSLENPAPSFKMKIGIYSIVDILKSLVPALRSVPLELDTEERIFSLFEKMSGEDRRKTSLNVDDYFDLIMNNDHPWKEKSKDFGSKKSKSRSMISPNTSISTSTKRVPSSVSFRSLNGKGGGNSTAGLKLSTGPDLTKENLRLALGSTTAGEDIVAANEVGIFKIFQTEKKIVSNGIKLTTPINFRDMPLSACVPPTIKKSTQSFAPSMSMSAASFQSSMDLEQQVKNVLNDVNRKLNKVKK